VAKKNVIQEKSLTPAEIAENAVKDFRRLSAKALAAEEAAHAAAIEAKKAKVAAQKAVDALKMATAGVVLQWDTTNESAAKTTAAVKAKRAEV